MLRVTSVLPCTKPGPTANRTIASEPPVSSSAPPTRAARSVPSPAGGAQPLSRAVTPGRDRKRRAGLGQSEQWHVGVDRFVPAVGHQVCLVPDAHVAGGTDLPVELLPGPVVRQARLGRRPLQVLR